MARDMNFGRNAPASPPPGRLGRASVLLALVAVLLLVGSPFVTLDIPDVGADLDTSPLLLTLTSLYVLVAPALNAMGMILAVLGLTRQNDSKVLCVIGIVLHMTMLGTSYFLAETFLRGGVSFL